VVMISYEKSQARRKKKIAARRKRGYIRTDGLHKGVPWYKLRFAR
jgi:hypothetical protein